MSESNKHKKDIKKEIENNPKKQRLSFNVRFRSFMAGLKKRRRISIKKFKSFLKSSGFRIPTKAIFFIILDGLIISLGLSYFIGFEIKYILLFGCGWYFLSEKMFPQMKTILNSISLVRITK